MIEPSPLKYKRIAAGLSQSALASSANISQQLMSKLETGAIALTPERAQVFARILGCSAIELLPALHTEPANDRNEVELLQIFRSLGSDRQEMILRISRSLLAESTQETAKASNDKK